MGTFLQILGAFIALGSLLLLGVSSLVAWTVAAAGAGVGLIFIALGMAVSLLTEIRDLLRRAEWRAEGHHPPELPQHHR